MSEKLIRVENLKKAYGENVILKDVSLSVREGEVVVILGPSGCGKSTLLRCLNGLETIQSGQVSFRGEVINAAEGDKPGRRSGRSGQDRGSGAQDRGSDAPGKRSGAQDSGSDAQGRGSNPQDSGSNARGKRSGAQDSGSDAHGKRSGAQDSGSYAQGRGRRRNGQEKQLAAIRQKVGMVFQSYELFPHKTILQNIMLAPLKVQKRDKKKVREEALALLKQVALEDKADAYPRQLSGGQRQRVAIVRALAMHPEVLLFDEVTAALDPEMIREVLEVLLRLAEQGRTMVIVTHEMAFARAIADRVIFLDQGGIVEEAGGNSFFRAPRTERARQFLSSFSYEKVQKNVRKTG